jgi:hypothetical protein
MNAKAVSMIGANGEEIEAYLARPIDHASLLPPVLGVIG